MQIRCKTNEISCLRETQEMDIQFLDNKTPFWVSTQAIFPTPVHLLKTLVIQLGIHFQADLQGCGKNVISTCISQSTDSVNFN